MEGAGSRPPPCWLRGRWAGGLEDAKLAWCEPAALGIGAVFTTTLGAEPGSAGAAEDGMTSGGSAGAASVDGVS